MTLSIAKFDTGVVPHTIVHETELSGTGSGTATLQIDVTQGDSGSLLFIDIHNAAAAAIYFHITLSDSSPANTSEADIVIPIAATTKKNVSIPQGIPFTYLSMWATVSATASNTTAPAGAVAVTLICS